MLFRSTPEARAGLGDRGVAEFLIRADILRIYAHVEGEVCLVEESKADGAWRGRFVGEHTYFTNGEHHARLGFTVTVAADGKVTVNGS